MVFQPCSSYYSKYRNNIPTKQLLPPKIYNTYQNYQYTPPISNAPSPYTVVSRSDDGVPF